MQNHIIYRFQSLYLYTYRQHNLNYKYQNLKMFLLHKISNFMLILQNKSSMSYHNFCIYFDLHKIFKDKLKYIDFNNNINYWYKINKPNILNLSKQRKMSGSLYKYYLKFLHNILKHIIVNSWIRSKSYPQDTLYSYYLSVQSILNILNHINYKYLLKYLRKIRMGM